MTPKPARALAWLTFSLGIVVSVLGNIGHAASDGMQPGEWAGAAFWPLALLLSIEVIVRVRWQLEKRWTLARFIGLVVVSVVAAILSYLHLRSLLIFWNYGAFQGSIGPLAVDGLMLIAASALLSISKEATHAQSPDFAADPGGDSVPADAPADVPANPTGDVGHLPDGVAASNAAPPPAHQPTAQDAEIGQLLSLVEDPQPEDKPVDKPKVSTSATVPSSVAEEAALQAWMSAPHDQKPSVRKLADLAGLSPSKTHRLIREWKQLETAR